MKRWNVLAIPAAAAAAIASYDLVQRRHALLRNFPVVGHGRYLLESLGPELRQYITTGNDEERPFTRDQRRWVYASSKRVTDTFGFGTDNDIEFTDGYTIIKHRTFSEIPPSAMPHADEHLAIPSAKVLGAARGRAHAFRPRSIVNISGMSFGALSSAAVVALNRGAAATDCLHNTGEVESPDTTGTAQTDLPDRDRVFRLPRRGRPVRPGAAPGAGRVGAGAGHRDQTQPGRETGPRGSPARGEGDTGDRRDQRRTGGP